MARIVLAACMLSFLVACARRDAGQALVKLLERDHDEESARDTDVIDHDSTYYIGYVDYFDDTREFYTTLYYREGHEHPDDDLLAVKLDSVIVSDDDWGRERLPLEDARELLVLDGLDTLAIYNRAHESICECPLTRVEYVWNGLDAHFVAVFKANTDFSGQTEEFYGISADFPRDYMTMFSSQELKDDTFDQFLLRKLNVADADHWNMRHYQVEPPDAMYSVLSSWSDNGSGTHSYLTFFERNKAQILNEENDNFHYLDILPVPVYMNGRPLLLISAGYPASDVLWDYLAGYDGVRYEAIDYNRVRLGDLDLKFKI